MRWAALVLLLTSVAANAKRDEAYYPYDGWRPFVFVERWIECGVVFSLMEPSDEATDAGAPDFAAIGAGMLDDPFVIGVPGHGLHTEMRERQELRWTGSGYDAHSQLDLYLLMQDCVRFVDARNLAPFEWGPMDRLPIRHGH